MDPLADLAYLLLEIGRALDGPETLRAQQQLERASDVVRSYTGQQFTRVEDDVAVLSVDRGQVVLPQWPNEKPTLIEYGDGSGVVGAGSWWWGGVGVVDLSPPSWVANGPSWPSRRVESVRVTYTHGYAQIPGDVQGIVAGMVARVVAVPGLMPGLKDGAVDDFRFSLGGNLTTGSIALTPGEMQQLDAYRRRVRSVGLSA